MKIKNNSGIAIKPVLFAFIASAVICTVIRCVQTAKYIDPETGFYVDGSFLGIVLYAVVFLFALYCLIVSFLSRETAKLQPIGTQSFLLGAVTTVFGLTLSYDWLHSLFSCFESLGNSTSMTGMKGLMSTGSLPLAVQSFFAFFASIYVYILAVGFFKGSEKASKFKILALSPVGWAAFRLIHRFIRQISFVEVSDLFLELIMLGLSVMFFVALAQVSSGVYSEGFSWRITGFGLPAALIAATLSITRLVFSYVEGGAFINPEHDFNMADFAFAFFAVILAVELMKRIDSNSEIKAESETENEVV